MNKDNMTKTWDIIKEVVNKKENIQVQDQFRFSNGEVTSTVLHINTSLFNLL